MNKLTIVMGPSNAGKSTYIRENLKGKVFDLFDYQKVLRTIDDVWRSYVECSNDLCSTLKENPNESYILEHTLLKRIRREWYLEEIRKVYAGPIEIICIKPSFETLKRNSEKRFGESISEVELKNSLDVLEIPTEDEGYSSVKIVEC